ncbi:MAG: Omp28-related outer membrane protein [Bacteroidales bacterium]|nr:Omp28-related outer membrane protein [Bacteroidales bacterium]
MKKKLQAVLLALALVFVFTSCDKDDDDNNNDSGLNPKQEQWGFAINYTATWCGPCGDWGAPLINDLNAEGKTVAITAHASGDPMYDSDLYNSFQQDRPGGGGIPSFWVGDTKSGSSSAISDLQNLKSQTAVAGIDLDFNISGGSASVETAVKFFEQGTGDYYLSVFVLEDGIDGSSSAGQYEQSGTSNSYPNDDYEHNYVLRASSVNGQAYGELIATDPASGKTVNNSYDIPVDGQWTNNVYIAAILWNYESGASPSYKFINAYK